MQAFPTPLMLHIKFDKVFKRTGSEIFLFEIGRIWGIVWRSRARNSKLSGHIWLEIESVRDFMPVLVICKFEENLIKNKDIIMETLSPLLIYEKHF